MKSLSVYPQITAALVTIISGAHAIAGTESSGGVENLSYDQGGAWFSDASGKPRVRTCLSVSAKFGMSQSELSPQVAAAFQNWAEYIEKTSRPAPAPPALKTPQPVTRVEILPVCDGTEDLKILFGMTNSAVNKAKLKYSAPFGFAEKVSYDVAEAWGKGFIWIAPPRSVGDGHPNWQKPGNLGAILLHELGHVMGVEHIPGTIMDPKIATWIKSDAPEVRVRLGQIDQNRELIPCWSCTRTYVGRKRGYLYFNFWGFEPLVGRLPTGRPYAKLIQEEFSPGHGQHPRGKFVLSNQGKEYEFEWKAVTPVPSQWDGPAVFKTFKKGSLLPYGYTSPSMSYLGTIQTAKGSLRQILVTYNVDQAIRLALIREAGDFQDGNHDLELIPIFGADHLPEL